MSTLNPTIRQSPLIQTLRRNTAKVREITSHANGKPLSEEEVNQVNQLAREMTKAITTYTP